MKKVFPLVLAAMIFSCSGFPTAVSGKKIDTAIPAELKGNTTMYLTDVEYLKDGLLMLLDNDSEWFAETELPAMVHVLAQKHGLNIIEKKKTLFSTIPANELKLSIWLHEMKKARSFPRVNTVSIIFTISKGKNDQKGTIMFIDETGYSVLNSSYAYDIMDKMLGRLAEEIANS